MNEKRYLKVVQGFALYHALAIMPLMIPGISDWVFACLGRLHSELALGGLWLGPHFSQMMFINLFAGAAFVWAVYRILHPSVAAGLVEGWGMLLFSAIVIGYVYRGVSPLWLIIPLVDLPGGLIHIYFARRNWDSLAR